MVRKVERKGVPFSLRVMIAYKQNNGRLARTQWRHQSLRGANDEVSVANMVGFLLVDARAPPLHTVINTLDP